MTSGRRRRPGNTASSWFGLAALCVVFSVAVWLSWPSVSGSSSLGSSTLSPLPRPESATESAAAEASKTPEELTEPAPRRLSPVEARVITSVPSAGKRVALTFDLCERDGDTAGYDAEIVSILKSARIKATFFMGGKWAESHPTEAAELGGWDAFEIGNHSWSHVDMEKTAGEESQVQVDKAQDSIVRTTGRLPSIFRFPFGTYSPASLRVVTESGLVPIEWSVVTGDPDKNVQAHDILRVVRQRTEDGSIVIMHANGRGWHTAEALPEVISYLQGQGYELVTVSELLAFEQ